jgi:hypothetical protein
VLLAPGSSLRVGLREQEEEDFTVGGDSESYRTFMR